MLALEFISKCKNWLAEQFENLTDEVVILDPSEWAPTRRYLPPQITPLPGFYSFDVAPYLREIIDCASPHSPIRIIDVMKGAQICFTVGILENTIGYYIDHVKSAPIMFISADKELANLRMETNIIPMINESGMAHLIKSSDENNPRKKGKTSKKIEWEGGGFLVPYGAQNANKLRSLSVPILLIDEWDGWPMVVGKDGKPSKLAEDRTSAFELTRKIFRGSTPLISQTSNIFPAYKKGDQRKYMIPCKHCHKKQELIFQKTHNDGLVYGIDFKRDGDGMLIEDSVVYLCEFCQGAMINEDKAWMLPRGEWVPTSRSDNPYHRSYHISALYSPVGMQSWTAIVRKWMDCWDIDAGRVKDLEEFQQFYNNVLGLPFETRGEALKFQRVITHRREVYHSGQILNSVVEKETGGKIQLITCAVDVHKEHLDVQVVGWAPRGCAYSLDWFKFKGDCENLEGEPWKEVQDLIENKIYTSDDGRVYKINITLIDSQYNADIVHRFCEDYSGGVYPCRGTEYQTKSAAQKEFSVFESKFRTSGYNITTTIYKDRLAASLKREWNGQDIQPDWHINFPQDYPDLFFKELTIEVKKEVINQKTRQRIGYVWVGRGAHAWDTLVYNSAGHDIVALNICETMLGLERIDRTVFWAACEEHALFWTKAA